MLFLLCGLCHEEGNLSTTDKVPDSDVIFISTLFQFQVVSGGVAANKYLRSKLWNLTRLFRHPLDFPPPHLCTDNGVMIAWAGMERLKAMDAGRFQVEKQKWLNGTEVCWTVEEQSALEPIPRLPLGTDISDKVKAMNIKIKRT